MIEPETPKFYRQRFLLSLLEVSGGRLSKMDFQKLIFLLQQEAEFSYYDFVPYYYGCYSFQAQSDIELLEKSGWLRISKKCVELVSKPIVYFKDEKLSIIRRFFDKFKELNGQELIVYTYKKYPYYAIKSKVAESLLDELAYKKIIEEKRKLQSSAKLVFTIGYEGLSFETYANQLILNDVRLLCDVRRNPLSRKFGFSKKALSYLLPKLGINYLHIPDLGIKSEDRKTLNTEADYFKLFEMYRKTLVQKEDVLQIVMTLLGEHKRIALTCFEKQHNFCHRHCISDYLESKNSIRISHL